MAVLAWLARPGSFPTLAVEPRVVQDASEGGEGYPTNGPNNAVVVGPARSLYGLVTVVRHAVFAVLHLITVMIY